MYLGDFGAPLQSSPDTFTKQSSQAKPCPLEACATPSNRLFLVGHSHIAPHQKAGWLNNISLDLVVFHRLRNFEPVCVEDFGNTEDRSPAGFGFPRAITSRGGGIGGIKGRPGGAEGFLHDGGGGLLLGSPGGTPAGDTGVIGTGGVIGAPAENANPGRGAGDTAFPSAGSGVIGVGMSAGNNPSITGGGMTEGIPATAS